MKSGFLIIDSAGPEFEQSIELFLKRDFPDTRLHVIPKDDSLFTFPNNISAELPAHWHKEGREIKGLKIDGSWRVFIHPANLKEGWKHPDLTTLSKKDRQTSLNLGINLIYYSFLERDKFVIALFKKREAERRGDPIAESLHQANEIVERAMILNEETILEFRAL